jgi:subtilisin family serine protease
MNSLLWKAAAAGITVVVAAGNARERCLPYLLPATNVITVGATEDDKKELVSPTKWNMP